jgi:hypothetical protein
LHVPGFGAAAPEQVLFVEFGQRVLPWQHGSPLEPQHTPLRARPLGQLVPVTQVSVAVLQSTPPVHWSTSYVLPPVV